MILAFTIGMLLIGQFVLRWQGRRTGRRGADQTMAGIITEQT
jgi:hypothetical protein